MKISIKHKREIRSAVRKLLDQTKGKRIYAFYGAMGAGKTTIIKALCEYLGAADLVSSPTFTLVNEYRTTGGESMYHIDFYRIKKHGVKNKCEPCGDGSSRGNSSCSSC